MQDAYLPQRLVDKLMYMYNYIEMARVTGVPMSFLLTRGQSIKVFSQILRKARQRNLLVPNMKVASSFPCTGSFCTACQQGSCIHALFFTALLGQASEYLQPFTMASRIMCSARQCSFPIYG